MNNKTAVDFLLKEISDILGGIITSPMQDLLMLDAFNKAKEMEKQQITNAAMWMPKPYDSLEFLPELARQYYKETYGNE